MQYDFDQKVDRRNTNSIKWDHMNIMFKEKDLLPLWVADMDFKSPDEIREAIIKRAQHGIFGYASGRDLEYLEVVCNWMRKRYDWEIKNEWVVVSPGIVPALSMAVQAFTKKKDKVIIQRPVYYPFTNVVVNNGRDILNNKLIYKHGRYEIDFDNLEELAKQDDAKLMLLCSPHNPVGRVWTKDELVEVARICLENKVVLVSDEIHADIIFEGYRHNPVLKLDKRFVENVVVCTAPSKTFNMAGLQISNIIIPNRDLRRKFRFVLEEKNGLATANPISMEAVKAAYTYGEDWLSQMVTYIQGNYEYLIEFCKENMPRVRVVHSEGTYLAWLDFSKTGLTAKELNEIIEKRAKVALDEGHIFGREGLGFERINMACTRKTLEECMNKIKKAMYEYIGEKNDDIDKEGQ